MAQAFREGRCSMCGQRVTVDREPDGHGRDGRWCGPVHTHNPAQARDRPYGDEWMVRRAPA